MNHLDAPFKPASPMIGLALDAEERVDAGAMTVRMLADQYLSNALPHFGMRARIAGVVAATDEATPQANELIFDEEKSVMGNSTVTYSHKIHGIPVWESGVVVQVEESPMQVIGSQSTFHHGIEVEPPKEVDSFRRQNIDANTVSRLVGANMGVNITVNDKKEFVFQYSEKLRVQIPYQHPEAMQFHLPPVAEGTSDGTIRVAVVWPSDWQSLATASRPSPTPISAGSDVVIGPFPWRPASGSPTLLMSVSATGDQSNIDLFTTANPVDVDRLVPLDNNIALRTIIATQHAFGLATT